MQDARQPPTRPWDILMDGDDTLWECGRYYREAEAICVQRIAQDWPDCPMSPAELQAHERKIQQTLLRRNGFYLTIFEDGWTENYTQLCHRYGRTVDQNVIRDLREATGTIHQAAYPLFPGTIDTLDRLLADGHFLHLVTLGEDAFQWSKIRRNQLEGHFSQIHVVQHGKQLVMRLVAQNGRPTMMVGDSIPSDIRPAKQLGLTPVWIHATDVWFRGDRELDLNGVHVIKDITEVPGLLTQLNNSFPAA